MLAMPKTVWVLGAGFPRSLGAPLLKDLFRQEERIDVQAYFPEAGFPGLARDMMATQITFNWGKDIEHLWEDAEQFLVFVDDAMSDSSPEKRTRLQNLTGRARRKSVGAEDMYYPRESGDVRPVMEAGLQRAARRTLVAETSRFMMTSRDGELWLPYREWASRLQPENDTIVTFNYDVLLDELGRKAPFTIPLPHEDPEQGKVPVLKLHGSANWLAEASTHRRQRDYEGLTHPSGAYPAIAAPGRSKSPDGMPPFPHLWELAEKAIEQAHHVIFLGYRFPPTDALARVRLSRALATTPPGQALRRIDTVLGPDIESNDSRRLFTLLVAARGERRLEDNPVYNVFQGSRFLVIERQPLSAEDFLTAYVDLARGQNWGI
jgi:hypothetical protein